MRVAGGGLRPLGVAVRARDWLAAGRASRDARRARVLLAAFFLPVQARCGREKVFPPSSLFLRMDSGNTFGGVYTKDSYAMGD